MSDSQLRAKILAIALDGGFCAETWDLITALCVEHAAAETQALREAALAVMKEYHIDLSEDQYMSDAVRRFLAFLPSTPGPAMKRYRITTNAAGIERADLIEDGQPSPEEEKP